MSSQCQFNKTIILVSIIYILYPFSSCKKLVDIPPPSNAITENNVYTNDATATAVLTGIYTNMMIGGFNRGPFTGNSSISVFSGLSADEFILYNGVTNQSHIAYYTNSLSSFLETGSEFWGPLYNYIYKCNAAIEGLTRTESLTQSIKQQLLGEAKFMRAFFYFYLVNLFGDLPLTVTTDYKVNLLLNRSPKSEVYQQIIADLKDAQTLLSSDYLKENLQQTTTERIRPTKWAATALLARVHLFNGDFANAEAQATLVINNTTTYGLATLNEVFLKNSKEAIWQLQPTTLNFNTEDAITFIIPATGPIGNNATNPVYLSKILLNSFEIDDLRAINGNWIDRTIYQISSTEYDTVYYPYKYKNNLANPDINPGTGSSNMVEYLMVLRLGEQYLIRAEARAQQSNIEGSKSDLNAIRTRAKLAGTLANDKNSLLTSVLHERQIELFAEWGNRWLDLKRTGGMDAVMTIVTPIKANGAIWQSFQHLYPLPQADLERAPNLVQNPGY